ncbi:MAG: HAMP domain-containing histidine kinase [Flavobacteriales bacterium]|nr:HAMP domain-containing histidine kinase [Flavobacteriales bacterium]
MFKRLAGSSLQRLILIAVFMTLLVSAFLIFSSYKQQIALSEEKELARLEGIASTLALEIDGNIHQALIERHGPIDAIMNNDDDAEYFAIHEQLKHVQDANMIETAIYTMVYDPGMKKFCFGVTSTNPFWKHPYLDYPEKLIDDYDHGGTIEMYVDSNGTWLSAFEPIKDRTGTTVGVLQVDQRFDSFIMEAQRNAWKNALIGIGVSLIIIGVLFISLRGIVQEQENLKKERDELDRLRTELLANVSHDLRTPLSSIQGYLETVLMKYSSLPPDRLEKYLGTSLKNTIKLRELVDELFELSKLQSRDRKPNIEPFSLSDLAQDIGASIRLNADKIGVDLIEQIPQNLPMVFGDISLIDRVIQNLTNNALKFTPQGGQVSITIAEVDEFLQITVADTGVGITEEDLEKVFDRFHTRPSGTTKGTGLGLAIVKSVLEAHDSEYHIQSRVNEGTSFWFRLRKV